MGDQHYDEATADPPQARRKEVGLIVPVDRNMRYLAPYPVMADEHMGDVVGKHWTIDWLGFTYYERTTYGLPNDQRAYGRVDFFVTYAQPIVETEENEDGPEYDVRFEAKAQGIGDDELDVAWGGSTAKLHMPDPDFVVPRNPS